MASAGPSRSHHQDYIARIRYTNTLPPPPNPPKLLDIPNTGLAAQYTTPGFASRLAREQPLNIEADGELGMPLDLVGMPGIFDGDESSIQAPSTIPVPHPHDRPLLRALSSLGKPKLSDAGVSFLRRTEYISSHTSKSRFDSTTSKSLISNTGNRGKRVVHDVDKESPEAIQKGVEDSFKIAINSLKNLSYIKHPSKPNLKLMDAFPLLPDHNCFTDVGGFAEIKFFTNPLPPSSHYDTRLDVAVLKPISLPDEEQEAIKLQMEAHKRDPDRVPMPDAVMQYELYLPSSEKDAALVKRKWDTLDPERDNESLYPFSGAGGGPCFRYKKLRAYESPSEKGSTAEGYDNEVLLALHDGSDGIRAKGAYYYPIIQKTQIRPQRNRHIEARRSRLHGGEEEDRCTDYIDMRVEDPPEEVKAVRDVYIEHPWGKPQEEEEGEEEEEDGAETAGTAAEGGSSQNVDADADADADNSDE